MGIDPFPYKLKDIEWLEKILISKGFCLKNSNNTWEKEIFKKLKGSYVMCPLNCPIYVMSAEASRF